MFSAFQTFGRLGAIGKAIAAAWSPLSLWPDGIDSPGMWISPRDLTSQWQDYTGTTPVSTPGTVADSSNPVGLALDIRAGATVLTDPGNHMLQSTSAARPLLSAYDGQTLGPGDTYDATGYPIFQKYDGTDDGMATASFAAGTLSNNMDCLIAVRRDSAASMVCGLLESSSSSKYTGACLPSGGPSCQHAGNPTVWVDNVQIAGATSDNRDLLNSAMTVGVWHILEFRGLDLSAWVGVEYGNYSGYQFPGPRGDIMLFPSTVPTADKDAARQYLADYYGVTLP